MQALKSSKGIGEDVARIQQDEVHDIKERERSVTFKEDREDALEPAWLKRNSISNSSSSSETPSQPRVFPTSQHKYSKEQLLELYKPSAQLPANFVTYPIITSEEVLIPVALLPPELQDEVILCTFYLFKTFKYIPFALNSYVSNIL